MIAGLAMGSATTPGPRPPLGRSLRGDREHSSGSQLLRDALSTIVVVADHGGGQVIVVDADNAGLVRWQGRHGFLPTGGNDLRRYMTVATARRHLGFGPPGLPGRLSVLD